MKARVTSFDFEGLGRDLQEAIERSVEHAARRLPEIQREQILAGLAPDGSPQKTTPGDDLPLYSTGRLADAGAWQVTETGNGFAVSPPADRVQVVEELKARGFRLLEPEHQVEPELTRTLEEELQKVKSQAAKYESQKEIG